MSAHSQTHPGLMPLSASAPSAGRGGEATTHWFGAAGACIARFGQRVLAAAIAGRMERAIQEIQRYDYRLAAEMRAAIDRDEMFGN